MLNSNSVFKELNKSTPYYYNGDGCQLMSYITVNYQDMIVTLVSDDTDSLWGIIVRRVGISRKPAKAKH